MKKNYFWVITENDEVVPHSASDSRSLLWNDLMTVYKSKLKSIKSKSSKVKRQVKILQLRKMGVDVVKAKLA